MPRITPIYTKYPFIEYSPIVENASNNIYGSVDVPIDIDGTDNVRIRKGAFSITFKETYNNPPSSEQEALTFALEYDNELFLERKTFLKLEFTQFQATNVNPTDGFLGTIYDIRQGKNYTIAFAYGGSNSRINIDSTIASYQSLFSGFLYPFDFENCLSYDSDNDRLVFSVKPILDNGGNVIDINSIFKGIYTFA